MGDWICLKCGTINKDIFGKTPSTDCEADYIKFFYDKRRELELEGKNWEYKCERCGVVRP